MTEDEFQALLQRYLDDRCTPAEKVLVEHWYNRLDEAQGGMLLSQNQEEIEDAIWQRLQHTKVNASSETRVVPHPATFWQKPLVRWAAALVLFALSVGLLLMFAESQVREPQQIVATADGWTRHRNNTQQVQEFQLPDMSRIELHPGSSLRYSTAFAGPKRQVYLQGEAFFKVSKNPARPFLVFTRQVVTTVLGTSFRVKAYADSKVASVAVREGKVAVQARKPAASDTASALVSAPSVLLLPNQQVVYSASSQRLKKELVDKPVVLAPQSFEFEERPVAEVLQALEKAYGVDIVYDKEMLAGCTVSITFYEEPLFEKLGLLCKSLDAYYSLSDAQIILHSKGCQQPLGG
ncbi:FecR family protein [Hymenobacter sp. HDW8]|uniref:FecR family protein n=1 Tax=Hymenobacter sp. HDW8 TaxID=2714932 RepID=UPI00140BE392|nr:FecR domain-containing protein [Hymenobacter sp. HDW8]QIL77051.1 DUF4974 domain-containing protein [Hymenobacter sp. HDW8]